MASRDYTNRDLILLKCRETIEALTSDLETERSSRLAAEHEISNLHQDLAALEESLDSLRDREHATEETVHLVEHERDEASQRIQRLEKEVASLKGEKDEQENKSQALQRKVQNMSEALERANREVGSKQQLITEWNQTLPSLESKLETISRENKRLIAEREHLAELYEKEREHTRRLQKIIEDKKGENDTLISKAKTMSDEFTQKISNLERVKTTQHQELAETYNRKANAYHEQLQQGLREQKVLIEKTTNEVSRLQLENEDLSSRLKTALELSESKKREIESLSQEKSSLEKELTSVLNDLEDLQKTQKLELDLKDKMHSTSLDEESQKVASLEAQLEDLTENLSHREEFYQQQLMETRANMQKTEDEVKIAQDSLRSAQKAGEEALQRMKSEHHEELQRLREEAEHNRERNLSTLESRMEEMECQRESDHDYFQIELLRAKEDYTKSLIAKEEELQKVKTERDRLRSQLELPPAIPSKAAPPRFPSTIVPSLRISSTSLKPTRQYSSHSVRQSYDSPHSSFSYTSRPDELKLYSLPRTARSDQVPASQTEGLKLLSQLKELTTRMEKATPEAVIIPVESDPVSQDESVSPTLSAEAPPEPLMTQSTSPPRHQRCFDCGQHAAARICICQFPLKSYCPTCAHAHLKRKGPKMHLLVPIHAAEMLVSEESVPDFITREVFSNNVTEALANNLTRVAGAKDELTAVCARLHSEIDAYRDARLGELSEIECELKQRIDVTQKGIEEIRYLQSFLPKNEPERLILDEWRNNISNMTERLSMFVYSATAEHIALQLPSIMHFHANYVVLYPPSSHQPRTYLPCIQSNCLKSLSLATHTWRDIPLSLHTDITYTSAISFLDSGDVFACGGKTHNKAYIIDGLTLEIREIAPMGMPRYLHGVIATPDDVYVFGGKNESDLRECEKYSLQKKCWRDLRQMHRPRSSLTPCRYYMQIFIAGGNTTTLEIYSLITDKFHLHQLSSHILTGATCISGDRSVLIIAKPIIIELDPAGRHTGKRSPLDGNEWWSGISPVSFNNEIYFSRRLTSGLPRVWKLNLVSKKVEEVA